MVGLLTEHLDWLPRAMAQGSTQSTHKNQALIGAKDSRDAGITHSVSLLQDLPNASVACAQAVA